MTALPPRPTNYESRWLTFKDAGASPSGKTRRWEVVTKQGGTVITDDLGGARPDPKAPRNVWERFAQAATRKDLRALATVRRLGVGSRPPQDKA